MTENIYIPGISKPSVEELTPMTDNLKARYEALRVELREARIGALYQLMDQAQRLEDIEVRYFCQFFGGDETRLYTQGGGYSVDTD
jgi:hypothetical protein